MSDEFYLAVVRQRIKRARLARDLRQEDMADMLDLSVRSYQRYEGGSLENQFNPYVTTIRRIARALGIDISEITREASARELEELNELPIRKRAKRRQRT